LALVIDAALLGFGNALFEHGPQRLGLRLGGDQTFAGDQRSHQVAHHGLLMGGVTAEPAASLGTTRN
jgi:hypothetical protein